MSNLISKMALFLPALAGLGVMKARGTKGIFLKAKSKMIDPKLSKKIDTALKQRQILQMKSKKMSAKNPVLALVALCSPLLYS